ncbi:HAD family hydrolase [Sedimentitalea sp. JM2-8]|uniref:phosphoglycolate phosphatase n=1 Tax=Sedimentitalea xiamensis TaxID=3050037 RepID=A0ABT7FFF0_9RHOB|nr:HAD family hydrolase [Sedimentitalea xiamensis]MDK3073864.1 HAD family hydrolase [Sedimentitalea xiamensis]
MAPVAAILFDKDGTLFDFAATWEAWARSFLLRATERDQDRAAYVGHQIGFDMASSRFQPDSIVIAGTPAEVAAALVPHLTHLSGDNILAMLNEEAEAAPQAEAVPLAPFLDRLRGLGLKLGVATNDAEAPALAHLGAAGVVDRFDFLAGFDSGYGAKPSPGQLIAFARAVGVHPENVAMVGDSTHDLIAGRAAGMRTVGVLTGMAGPADLGPYADVILPDIGHLPAWLGV